MKVYNQNCFSLIKFVHIDFHTNLPPFLFMRFHFPLHLSTRCTTDKAKAWIPLGTSVSHRGYDTVWVSHVFKPQRETLLTWLFFPGLCALNQE